MTTPPNSDGPDSDGPDSDGPGSRREVHGGQGVQVGSGSQQINVYGHVDVYINAALVAGTVAAGNVSQSLGQDTQAVESLSVNAAVLRTKIQLDTIIKDRPLGWEYLLFAGALIVEMEALDARYRDYLIGYAPRPGVLVYKANFVEFYQMQFGELRNISQQFKQIFSNQAVDGAISLGGVSGDPAKILHLAKRYISVYDELLRWTERLRGTAVPVEYQQLINILSRYSEQPITEIRRFVDDYARLIARAVEALENGQSTNFPIRVKFVVPPELSKELKDEWARINDRA
jgi:hypothetical protein